MSEATVCKKCTYMRSYGEGLSKCAVGFDRVKNIEPCSACGNGQMEIIDVNVDAWCDDCCKHRSRCKCGETESMRW